MRTARKAGAACADLLRAAERALPAIAREFCTAARSQSRGPTAIAPEELWRASVAGLLRMWFKESNSEGAAPFFAGGRCQLAVERFHGRSQPAVSDESILVEWQEASARIGKTANETQYVAQLFQQLKERCFELLNGDATPRLLRDRGGRRAAGSYYTPAPLIDYIVRETVGAAWREHWKKQTRCEQARGNARRPGAVFLALASFRVVDPACGGGDFLLAALDHLQSVAELLVADEPARRVRAELVDTLAACGFSRTATRTRAISQLLRWLIAAQCLFGVDLDPLAVELSRARLWLALYSPPTDVTWFDTNIRPGNALVDDACEVADSRASFEWRREFPQVLEGRSPPDLPGFQAVIGNPPYGAMWDAGLRKMLARRWPQMRHNSDAVVGFISRAEEICAPDGHLGLVVPKPLTYSFAWRHVREVLYDRLDYCVDVSRAWPEVLLEQVLLGWRPSMNRNTTFRGGECVDGKFRNVHHAARGGSRRAGAILCSLRPAERQLLARLERSDYCVGDICRTFRGLPLQRELYDTGEIPVLGGRDLARWRLRGASGYLPAESLVELEPFRQEKLVVQNIIAHIMRPAPHIRLIGARDTTGQLTLDTVNNLVARESAIDLSALLALLHSRLVNWFVYGVVYNKAIRTMHFDQYFLNKIPLPAGWEKASPSLAELSQDAEMATRTGDETVQKQVEAKIDRLVLRAYGVPKRIADDVL